MTVELDDEVDKLARSMTNVEMSKYPGWKKAEAFLASNCRYGPEVEKSIRVQYTIRRFSIRSSVAECIALIYNECDKCGVDVECIYAIFESNVFSTYWKTKNEADETWFRLRWR